MDVAEGPRIAAIAQLTTRSRTHYARAVCREEATVRKDPVNKAAEGRLVAPRCPRRRRGLPHRRRDTSVQPGRLTRAGAREATPVSGMSGGEQDDPGNVSQQRSAGGGAAGSR